MKTIETISEVLKNNLVVIIEHPKYKRVMNLVGEDGKNSVVVETKEGREIEYSQLATEERKEILISVVNKLDD